MSNEALVKQLRKLAPICRGQAEIYVEKAADEIERLLAENAELRKALEISRKEMERRKLFGEANFILRQRDEAIEELIEAVQQEHGGDITNPKCLICIAINAFNKEKNNG